MHRHQAKLPTLFKPTSFLVPRIGLAWGMRFQTHEDNNIHKDVRGGAAQSQRHLSLLQAYQRHLYQFVASRARRARRARGFSAGTSVILIARMGSMYDHSICLQFRVYNGTALDADQIASLERNSAGTLPDRLRPSSQQTQPSGR